MENSGQQGSRLKSCTLKWFTLAGPNSKLVCPFLFHVSTNFSLLFLEDLFESKHLNTAIKISDYFLLVAAVHTLVLLDAFGTNRGMHW